MRIATASSHGPNVLNLQLGVWRHAVVQFESLRNPHSEEARELLSRPIDEEDGYSENEFVVDAAVAVVLAGASVNQLLGQNSKQRRKGGGIKGYWDCWKEFFCASKESASPELKKFIEDSDCFKHFGEPHHERIKALTPDLLCQHMAAAQSLWIDVLTKLEIKVPAQDFRHEFRLDIEYE